MIQFKKVILHNFGSYGHAELDLQNRGFCLVSGFNNYVKDNALSNGSGKSFLFSAICYALTGETINGIKTNLKNINIEDLDSFVQLEFLYNKDLYNICRIVTPKSDLKVFKNDIDLSGKGIRESEKILQELIPDLTKDLIASTIMLGQGLPNKFSSFSPSGRKDLLEKLTKSDFMIEDLKARILARQQELGTKVREFEDSLLTNKTQLNSYLAVLEKLRVTVENEQQPDFDALIKLKNEKIKSLQQQLAADSATINSINNAIENLNKKVLEVSEEKARVSNEELTAYTASFTKLSEEKTKLDVEVNNLNREITKLKAIIDVCPTCGQHIPNIQKPDTSALEASLQSNIIALNTTKENITKCNNQHQEYLIQIEKAFKEELTALNNELNIAKQSLSSININRDSTQAALEMEKNSYNKLLYDKQNWESYIKKQQNELQQLETEVARLTNLISITSMSKDDIDQRIAVVKKMDQLIRRDFRGYLLTNIISYIDTKAKDYCNTVFGTKDLSISLNGNALDITYCGKMFDGLSGGEKQRVDLIIQLAIRDLLSSYLGLSANILVLDEVTDFLDKKSCKAVMQLLENELNTVESVFIISHHHDTLEITVDSELKIVKNELGISEIY